MASRPSRSPSPGKGPRYKFLVSACLAGVDCTYNGKSNPQPAIKKLFMAGDCMLVCPEIMGGLPVPRSRMEISGGDGLAVLRKKARVITADGRDVTEECVRGAKIIANLAKRYGIRQAILKSKSPCCGKGHIYDGTFSGTLKRGDGILTSALISSGVKVCSETSY